MKPLFLYGTLQDPEVFLLITQKSLKSYHPQGARLPDHAVRYVEGEAFPALQQAPGESTIGVLIHGINNALLNLLKQYESDEYELKETLVMIAKGTPAYSQCFYPKTELTLTEKSWDYEEWRMDHKLEFLQQVKTYLDTGQWKLAR